MKTSSLFLYFFHDVIWRFMHTVIIMQRISLYFYAILIHSTDFFCASEYSLPPSLMSPEWWHVCFGVMMVCFSLCTVLRVTKSENFPDSKIFAAKTSQIKRVNFQIRDKCAYKVVLQDFMHKIVRKLSRLSGNFPDHTDTVLDHPNSL